MNEKSGSDLDIAANRGSVKYSFNEQLRRIFWIFGQILFRFSFRTMFGWRNFILRIYGAKIGKNVNIYNTAKIYMPWNFEIGDWSSIGEDVLIYNLGIVVVGSKSTISHRSHICAGTHDYTNVNLPLLKPPVMVGNQVWICADSFIGPGITINEGAVVAARAVVVKSVPEWQIVAGNPAKFIGERKLEV